MKPPACPECGGTRLYHVWRRAASGDLEETWGCRGCYVIGAWRLATAPTLTAATDAELARTVPGHKRSAIAGVLEAPPASVPSQRLSRDAIRALFADLEDQ